MHDVLSLSSSPDEASFVSRLAKVQEQKMGKKTEEDMDQMK